MDDYDQDVLTEIITTKSRRYASAKKWRIVSMFMALTASLSSAIAAFLIAVGVSDNTTLVAAIAAIPALIATLNSQVKAYSRSQWHRQYALSLDDLEAEAKYKALSGLDLDKKLNEVKRTFSESSDGWI